METKQTNRHLRRRVLIEAVGLLLAIAWFGSAIYLLDAFLN